MHGQSRKSSFKTPPADTEASQHARRERALEEQKRKRAQRVDSSRNLDMFSSLSLGPDASDDPDEQPEIIQGGLSHFASLLPSSSNASKVSMETRPPTEKSRKRKVHAHFANKIMYAELLEMKDDQSLTMEGISEGVDSGGLPADLDANWVALTPVPQGKRCMAVSNQASGVPGSVSGTFLKSRLKGHTILTFPSPFPPSTILDCILDENWKLNGILHVLDIMRWKGQEVGDCEANFRFWWRDTRLSELVSLPAPSNFTEVSSDPTSSFSRSQARQLFSYPTVFLPVPYHLDLSLPSLLSTIIPLSRSFRHLTIQLPLRSSFDPAEGDMEVDQQSTPPVNSQCSTVSIKPDGLLLYVSHASYESGTSPLSMWVPIRSYEEEHESPLTIFQRLVARRASSSYQKGDDPMSIEVGMEHRGGDSF